MISIIIVNYQTYNETFECVDSLLKSQTTEDFCIIIVDNASENDSWERLQVLSDNPQIILLRAQDNNGYCAGNNIGIKYVIENLKTDYIWILNPDTLVATDTMQELYNCANTQKDLGILGCKLVYYPDTQYMQALGGGYYGTSKLGAIGPKPQLYHMQSTDIALPKVITIDSVIGASMFIPINIFSCVGLMNEKLFMYYDETEFCLRVLKAGFKNYATSSAVVYHKEGARQKGRTLVAEYYYNRNALHIVRELYPHNLKYNILEYLIFTFILLCKLKFKIVVYRIKALMDFKNNIYGKVRL